MNSFFRFIWFLLAVAGVILALRAMSWADKDMHGIEPEPIRRHVR